MFRKPRRHFNAVVMNSRMRILASFSGGFKFIWAHIAKLETLSKAEGLEITVAVNPTCGDAAFINRKPGYGWRMGR